MATQSKISGVDFQRGIREGVKNLIVADMSVNGGGGGGKPPVRNQLGFFSSKSEKDAQCSEMENYVFLR